MRTLCSSLALLAPLFVAGCRAPGFDEVRVSLPGAGEAAKLVVKLDGQPITLRFDASSVDYAEWTPHPVDDPPPPPLEAVPPGARPRGAWVLRLRMRGTAAMIPSAYMARRDGSGLLYSTRRVVGRLEPGAGFDVLSDGAVRVANPAAPPSVLEPEPYLPFEEPVPLEAK